MNLINFDSQRVYGLPGYYVQKLFSEHRGDVVLPVEAASPAEEASGRPGMIGVGTWATQAEYKDIRVTGEDGQILFASDFGKDLQDWKPLSGRWQAVDGVLRQTSNATDVRALAGDPNWRDYTLSLKARKLGGDEGFLVLFQVENERQKCWWNIGGWGNREHGLEVPGVAAEHVRGSIDTGRWYDIRVEVDGPRIRCFLDDKLIHDATRGVAASLFASASLVENTGEVILKVVNAADNEQSVAFELRGLAQATATEAIVLTSDSPADENTLDTPNKVVPRTRQVSIHSPKFRHALPGNSVTVLRFATR